MCVCVPVSHETKVSTIERTSITPTVMPTVAFWNPLSCFDMVMDTRFYAARLETPQPICVVVVAAAFPGSLYILPHTVLLNLCVLMNGALFVRIRKDGEKTNDAPPNSECQMSALHVEAKDDGTPPNSRVVKTLSRCSLLLVTPSGGVTILRKNIWTMGIRYGY